MLKLALFSKHPISSANIFIILISSSLISFFLVPKFIKYGEYLDLYDYPGERKIHERPLLRSGGIPLFISFLLPSIIFSNFLNLGQSVNYVFLTGSGLFFLIGLLDDFFNISPYIKLFLQILFTYLLFYLGIKIIGIDFSDTFFFNSKIIFPEYISILITTFWIVGITNSINWIDGLDGLASGITVIFSLGTLIIGIIKGNNDFIIFSSSLLGANLGFLKYNFNPAKILMGDSGSYFLGFTLSILSLQISKIEPNYFINVQTILLLGLPILDMVSVISNRFLNGRNPFYADNSHLHHRLLKKVVNQKKAVIFLYMISICFTSLALFLILI